MLLYDCTTVFGSLVYVSGVSTYKQHWKKCLEMLKYEYFDRYFIILMIRFVCVKVLRPSQPSRVMSSAVNLPNHTFTGQA